MSMKLVLTFTGCNQVGIDSFVDSYTVRVIELTDEQKKLLIPPQGMSNPSVVYAYVEEETKNKS